MELLPAHLFNLIPPDYGAKIYFNTLIPFEDGLIKYGVISTEHLIKDLTGWDNIFDSLKNRAMDFLLVF